jgi:hypothetical protein
VLLFGSLVVRGNEMDHAGFLRHLVAKAVQELERVRADLLEPDRGLAGRFTFERQERHVHRTAAARSFFPGRHNAAVSERTRAMAAGAAAAAVWGLQEPLDRRFFRCDYSDVALLGRAVTRGRLWRPAGFAIHVANGAVFGLVYHEARRRLPASGRTLAVGMALSEHAFLYPLCYFVDRHHPARGEPGIPPLLTNPRAYAQATWRHALFGLVLGRLG